MTTEDRPRHEQDSSRDDQDPEAQEASPLTAEELEEFRRLLKEKQRAILGDVTGMAAEARGSSLRADGSADEPAMDKSAFPDDLSDHDLTMGLLETERVLLREVAEALDRIEHGTYGVCLATGRPISKARLLARPWSKFCIEHARKMETRGGPGGGATHFGGPSAGRPRPAFRSTDSDEPQRDALEVRDLANGMLAAEGEEY